MIQSLGPGILALAHALSLSLSLSFVSILQVCVFLESQAHGKRNRAEVNLQRSASLHVESPSTTTRLWVPRLWQARLFHRTRKDSVAANTNKECCTKSEPVSLCLRRPFCLSPSPPESTYNTYEERFFCLLKTLCHPKLLCCCDIPKTEEQN